MSVAMLPSEVAQIAAEVEQFINYWHASSLDEALGCVREYEDWLARTGHDHVEEDLTCQ